MKNFQDFCDSLDQEFIDTLKSETSYVLHNAAAPENIFFEWKLRNHYEDFRTLPRMAPFGV